MLYTETILFQLSLFFSTRTLLLTSPDSVLSSFILSKLAVAIDFYHVQQKHDKNPSFSPLLKIFQQGLVIYQHIDHLANLATKFRGKKEEHHLI